MGFFKNMNMCLLNPGIAGFAQLIIFHPISIQSVQIQKTSGMRHRGSSHVGGVPRVMHTKPCFVLGFEHYISSADGSGRAKPLWQKSYMYVNREPVASMRGTLQFDLVDHGSYMDLSILHLLLVKYLLICNTAEIR